MQRILIIAAAGLTLAGCGSMSLPGTDWFRSAPPEAPLKLESSPPGADARTSLGPACKTPCVVNVPADKSFTVTFTLDKHQPQTIPVQVIQGTSEPSGEGTFSAQSVAFDPSPVYAELVPAKPTRPAPAKKKAAPKPRPAAPAASSGSPFPEPSGGGSPAFPPPPGTR